MSIDDHGAEHEQSMIVRDPLGERNIRMKMQNSFLFDINLESIFSETLL